MTTFIDLQRCFHKLTTLELESSENLAYLNEREFGASLGWPELLAHSRVILLAEAGTGKTLEMVEQAKRLVGEGKFAFFVALESLSREPLTNLLSASDERLFEDWKSDGQAPGWFFLDAVDELKLTGGKLDRAILRLSKELDGRLDRARIIISCRPTDWRSNIDLATIQNRLPLLPRLEKKFSSSSDEIFIEALRRDRGKSASTSDNEESAEISDTVLTVVLLPMNNRQIKLFAEQSGVHDTSAFLAEIDRQNAWAFARRPLDLTELVTAWASSNRLGTRTEQHETNVTTKLKDDPERPDRGVLTDTQSRLGAERLALALALTRTRTIRSPDQALDVQRAVGVLDPATILRDWTEEERQALLRRALFDPATYGRVRFHHRSVQEYLAAQHLHGLREKGMSTKAVFRLLFAQRYGVDVVFPSMRAITAWLALWDEDVRRELTRREPEALLSLGDPETLNLTARTDLLRAFAASYGQGGWRGLDIPIDEVRRLAHPDLAPVIRELWADGPTNDDVRELLIFMIWQGQIVDCADLAHSAAMDMAWGEYHRISAIKALLACGLTEAVREIADSIIAQPQIWPDRIAHGIAADIFPHIIAVDELVLLMERTSEPKQTIGGFNWATRRIAESIDPWSDIAVSLRNKIADLIWRRRHEEQDPYRIRSNYEHLTHGLSLLCSRQLSTSTSRADANLIRACVIASRFGEYDATTRETGGNLRLHFQENLMLRCDVFWAELAFMDEIAPDNDDVHRYYQTEHGSLLGHLTEADRPWLKDALVDDKRPERRAVALHALLWDWRQGKQDTSDLDTLRSYLKGDPSLNAILAECTTPMARNKEYEKMKRERERRKLALAVQEEQRLQSWKEWRAKVIAAPDIAFSAEEQAITMHNLYMWLSASNKSLDHYNVWNKAALKHAFGEDIAERAEKMFRDFWRTTQPLLWSSRPAKERNTTPYAWICGLCGISAEASSSNWTASLSSTDARTAVVYATLELNGFAPFIADLAQSHSSETEAVLGDEIIAEISTGADYDHLPMLHDLAYADDNLKQLLSPRMLATITEWPSEFTEEAGPRWANHLDQVLRILEKTSSETNRHLIAQECAKRYVADPFSPLALVWLRGLFRFDADRGTQTLTTSLALGDEPKMRARAIKAFASIFGNRDAVLFEIADPAERASALGKLVRCAYAFIRHEDDQAHEGVYSPNTRDDAERARNFLLSALLDTPGSEARSVILDLAAEPDFAHFPDRLRLLARKKTATDSEFAPFDPEDLVTLESRYEAPPHDRDGLFTVMLDRLDDLAHDVSHNDFTDRRTLRTITEEVEMQRTLALRIRAKANGAFTVTREDEVADQKRTDIRLLAVKDDQKAVIEVKIADKRWRVPDFERALRAQLVGQYLRHATCKAGCLLLTYNGDKKYWMSPHNRKRLTFQQTIEYLNEKAREIENESLHSIRIGVFGLDLTDPPLAPAHRGKTKRIRK